MPTVDGGNDVIRVFGPDEGVGIVIVLFEESFDGRLKVDDRVEHFPFQPSFGERCEETLDGIEP